MKKLINYFTKGHQRSIKAKKNIAASLLIRISDIGLGIILVPIILNYLGHTNYGIWLTMISMVSWFSFLNVGLGHGLRNKFAEAKAIGDYKKVKYFVSTTYAIIGIIAICFFLLFLIGNNFIDWSKLLNSDLPNSQLSLLAVIVFGSFSIRLVIRLITTITTADQYPAIRDAVMLAGKILVFIVIIISVRTVPSSLIYVSTVYTLIPILILIVLSFYFYSKKYKKFRPSFKYIELEYAGELLNLGWKFLIIQIGAAVLHTTDNFIISNIFNPDLVVPYQISYKYFALATFIYIIIIDPFWSAVTEAKAKKDFEWINRTMKKYFKLVGLFLIILIIMVVVADMVYSIWIGDSIQIPFYLNILWGLTILLGIINVTIGRYLNGMGYTYISVFGSLTIIVLNIPLSYVFAIYVTGNIGGVLIATMICIGIVLSMRLVQFHKISRGRKGIWIK